MTIPKNNKVFFHSVVTLIFLQVRETNMHIEDTPCTYFGLQIEDFDNFKKCWQECKERSEYVVRRREVDAYNRYFGQFILCTTTLGTSVQKPTGFFYMTSAKSGGGNTT